MTKYIINNLAGDDDYIEKKYVNTPIDEKDFNRILINEIKAYCQCFEESYRKTKKESLAQLEETKGLVINGLFFRILED